ncbi:MAG TPA: DUF6516 family protein, partial [Aestuariivirga sp.]
ESEAASQVERSSFGRAILEMVIWLLPIPVPGCSHHYKYSLYYGKVGRCLVGYDNERPKGIIATKMEKSCLTTLAALIN